MRLSIFILFVVVLATTTVTLTGCGNRQTTTPICETFVELADPTSDTLSDWSGIPGGLHASFVTIDKRHLKSVAPRLEQRRKDTVVGWKGETVSAQLLLWTTEKATQVAVRFNDFTSADAATLRADIAQARFVRYVMTDEFADGCGKRNPNDFSASLSADMLDSLSCFDVEAQTVRPVWVSIEIPRDAKAGLYRSIVQITTKGKPLHTLEMTLEVVDHELPPPVEWTFHLDQWQHPSAVARVEGLDLWSDEHFEAMRPVMQMLADAGQKVITATLNKDPWNVQTFDPYADMIIWEKQEDGTWSYDYAVFDRWVQFMLDLGINKAINCYSIIPWNNEIHYRDRGTGETVNVKADPGTPIFEELWKPFVKDFSNHLKQKGWLEITNIAMDERDPESMDAAFELINSVAPELGIAFADNKKTYQKYPNSADISVSAYHPFDPKDLMDRQNRGLITTYYVCCEDPFPNQFTFSDPAESTYLAWYAMAAGFDGMLRWAFNSWVEHPMLDSRFRTWPAGDTYIVYPGGRSSIRYERMREGIQDYEKINFIRKVLEQEANTAALARLEQAIGKMKRVERLPTWNANLNEAKRLLNELSGSALSGAVKVR